MMILKFPRVYVVILFLYFSFTSFGQVKTYPIPLNASIRSFLETNTSYSFESKTKNKFGQKDTLDLPFFDDFSESHLYPDSSKWLNNQVYVNNHFPYHPPTINVATFDGLNAQGLPYNNTINKDKSGPGDSLISQPINLKDSAGTPYTLQDSMVFSFFYQPNGLGYHLNNEDSLRLWFKSSNHIWIPIWSVGGQFSSNEFIHVSIPIVDENYLHPSFQFMFTTFTRQVGNANHWHLDYIYLDKDRSSSNKSYNDYAIQTTPSPLLKMYTQMPYSHFSVNPSSHMADSIYIRLSNLYKEPKALQLRHEASFEGTTIGSSAFINSTKNIGFQTSDIRDLPNYKDISGLTNNSSVVINRLVEVRENGVANEYKRNDSIVFTQEFHDFYAYDDGSAEQGFGFDQNTNPSNIQGEIAYGFDIYKEDTLNAIATFFNEAVYDVSRKRFKYRIWKSLEGIDNMIEDELIYESEELSPSYSSKNNWRTFTPHYLDTTLILTPGRYYIGWWQGSMYNLNVGWDKNYGYANKPNQINQRIYFKTFGTWNNSDIPGGTLMMRPHFGSQKNLYTAQSKQIEPNNTVYIYPNPAHDMVYLSQEFEHVSIADIQGNIMLEFRNSTNLKISNLQAGIYILYLEDKSKRFYTTKLIIQ
ncbi:T9SS type A sorting domain-containing protein [Bacteroidia bacterium]|mgnify:FL=1|nr:T9SS type A sorting domain-containing protein [Bacteroidia bacterium]